VLTSGGRGSRHAAADPPQPVRQSRRTDRWRRRLPAVGVAWSSCR